MADELGVVVGITVLTLLFIAVNWWWEWMTAERERRHFDPDAYHSGVQWPDQQQQVLKRTVVLVKKRKKSA